MKKKTKKGISKIKIGIIDLSVVVRRFITYKFILLIIALIMCGHYFTMYKNSVQNKINKNSKEYCKSVVSESIDKMEIKLGDEMAVLNTLAVIYKGDTDEDIETTAEYYQEILNAHDIISIQAYNAGQQKLIAIGDVNDDDISEFCGDVLEGNEKISGVKYDDTYTDGYVYLGVPIYKSGNENIEKMTLQDSEDEIIGALVCKFDVSKFTDIIDSSNFEEMGGNTFVAQSDGTTIARPDNVSAKTNLFDVFEALKANDEETIEKVQKDIESGRLKEGRIYIKQYGSGKYGRYICYSKLADSEWYSVSIISKNTINKLAKKVSNRAGKLSFEFACIFALYVIVAMAIDIKLYQKEKQKNRDEKNEIEEIEKKEITGNESDKTDDENESEK